MVVQKCNVTYFLSRKEFKQNRFISKVYPNLQRVGGMVVYMCPFNFKLCKLFLSHSIFMLPIIIMK